MIDNALQRLTEWIPADPTNLLMAAGAGLVALASSFLAAVRDRNRAQRLEAGVQSDAAIHYMVNGASDGQKYLPPLVFVVFWLFEIWDSHRGAFDLQKLAIVGVPLLLAFLFLERRQLRIRPAVAVYQRGLLLDSWRGETMVPWEDVAYIETDPAESTGYQPNTQCRLLVGRKDGRKWRYSERDFGDDVPSQFETIVALARRHIR